MKILSISNDYLSSKGRTNFMGEIHSMADAMRELDILQRKYANSNGDTFEGNYSTKLEKEVAKSSAAASRGIAAMSEYDKLLRAIELLPPDLPSTKQAKFVDFVNRVQASAPQKMSKVAGYDNLKQRMIDDFVISTIGVDKVTNNKVKVPNAVLLYGPTGTGKSNLAFAIAELTESFVKRPTFKNEQNSSLDSLLIKQYEREEKYFELVKQQCEEAKTNYLRSGSNKKRTVIILDEADSVLSKESSVKHKFYDLMKNSAEKNKVIFFINSNNPLDLDERFLKPEICGEFNASMDGSQKRAIIYMPPATRQDAEAIIRHTFSNEVGRSLGLDSPNSFLDYLFRDTEKLYSNSDIKYIIKMARVRLLANNQTRHLTILDCLKEVQEGNCEPLIQKMKWDNIYAQMKQIVRNVR